ncbi:hypothetical protein VPNG_01073 [Cytospora leucostoma]|uniref:Uncharacterized protein n=1 Tax=Cytospora leucostoma TaxID=1230097 RepID=A0A423XL29_9PEZI|nr:hypothetical protein VPNG_01073 [Cytospora leucostoma]
MWGQSHGSGYKKKKDDQKENLREEGMEAGSGGQLGKEWGTTQAGCEVTNVEMTQANLIWSLQAREI